MEFIVQMIYYMIALCNAFVLLRCYNRGSKMSKKLSLAMLMNFFMIGFYSLNLSVDNMVVKSIGCSMAFIFTDLMLYFYLDFMLSYIHFDERVPKIAYYFTAGFIALDSIFLLINPYNEVALSYIPHPFGEGYLLTYLPKIPFHLHTIFNISMIFAMILLLVLKTFEVPKVYFKRYVGPITGMGLVIVLHLVYLSGVFPFNMDPTPLMYVLVSFVFYFFTFDYLPGVTLGITRKMILQYLHDPIILFDYEGQLADHSCVMESLMPDITFSNGMLSLDEFIKKAGFSNIGSLERDQEFDWSIDDGEKRYIYQCNLCIMKDEGERLIGTLFMFHDVTDVRDTYFELEKTMMLDSVTGFYNKQSLYTQFPQWNNPEYWPVSIAVLNVDGMTALNEAYGTDFGDAVMRESARYVRRRVGDEMFCAKSDNGDIVVILEKTTNADAGDIMEAVRADILDFYENMPVSIEFGIATKEERTVSVEKVLQNAHASMQNKKMLKEKSASSSLVDSLKQTLCESDYQTEAHVERTRQMAARLGRRMGLEDAEIGKLELLAVLHDIGKVAIPQDIIKKKGKLTPEERTIIEQHTVKGYRIAKSSPELSEIADGILCHHEKWDGTGYPNGYTGEEIPLIARIISAVDSHDVMVNDRPYHKAMPERDAILELQRCSGTQFDPNIIEIFTRLLEEEELPKQEGEGATMENPPAGYQSREERKRQTEGTDLAATAIIEQNSSAAESKNTEVTGSGKPMLSDLAQSNAEYEAKSPYAEYAQKEVAAMVAQAVLKTEMSFKEAVKERSSLNQTQEKPGNMRSLIIEKVLGGKDPELDRLSAEKNGTQEVQTQKNESDEAVLQVTESDAAVSQEKESDEAVLQVTESDAAVSQVNESEEVLSHRYEEEETVSQTEEVMREVHSTENTERKTSWSIADEEAKTMQTAYQEEGKDVQTMAEAAMNYEELFDQIIASTQSSPTMFRIRDDVVVAPKNPGGSAPMGREGVLASKQKNELTQEKADADDKGDIPGRIKVSNLRIAQ